MVYLCAIVGFILGFVGGMFIINLFLANYPNSELVKNRSLRWTYGLSVWIFAALGAWGGVWLYDRSLL